MEFGRDKEEYYSETKVLFTKLGIRFNFFTEFENIVFYICKK
jgi:hypothetical protein